MDRETALHSYHGAVSGRIEKFRKDMETYILDRAEALEAMVKDAMVLLGAQMEKQGKEYVCFLYFSLLKIDLTNRKYRFLLQGLDMRWYLDEEPAEVYVEAGDLFAPFEVLREDLIKESGGYGGAISIYDIQNILFDELSYIDGSICQILRYRLRDWEKKGIFDCVTRSPYWILKWGEYRDRTEILIQTDRVEKEKNVWKEELAKAAHKPETMVFSYWYKGEYEKDTAKELDMRFITFEECTISHMVFQGCSMEGSRFINCRITGCTFTGCNLWGADFRGSRIEQTSFDNAVLTAAVFPAGSVPFLGISAEQLQEIQIGREEET